MSNRYVWDSRLFLEGNWKRVSIYYKHMSRDDRLDLLRDLMEKVDENAVGRWCSNDDGRRHMFAFENERDALYTKMVCPVDVVIAKLKLNKQRRQRLASWNECPPPRKLDGSDTPEHCSGCGNNWWRGKPVRMFGDTDKCLNCAAYEGLMK